MVSVQCRQPHVPHPPSTPSLSPQHTVLHRRQHGDGPATARAAANPSHGMWDAQTPWGTASTGGAPNVAVWHKLAATKPGLHRDLHGESDSEKYQVMDKLEDEAYVRQGCKRRPRSSAPTTLTCKWKEHPRHTHPDPPHGRHNLHPTVWPWHIQAPDVLEEKKELISRLSTALETSGSHHGLDGIPGWNAGSLLGNRKFGPPHLKPSTPPTMKLFPPYNVSSIQQPLF